MHVHHHAPGSFCWFELSTTDQEHAKTFYSALFGWQAEDQPVGPNDYGHIVNGDEFIGGVAPVSSHAKSTPPHWLIYFAVPDCDAVAAKAKSAGATILMPPMTIAKVRKFAVLADPQGAAFAIVEPGEE